MLVGLLLLLALSSLIWFRTTYKTLTLIYQSNTHYSAHLGADAQEDTLNMALIKFRGRSPWRLIILTSVPVFMGVEFAVLREWKLTLQENLTMISLIAPWLIYYRQLQWQLQWTQQDGAPTLRVLWLARPQDQSIMPWLQWGILRMQS